MVDFKKVIENAETQGLDLQEIAIIYDDLTPEEYAHLAHHQVIVRDLGERGFLVKFPINGFPLYENKATAVLTLSG